MDVGVNVTAYTLRGTKPENAPFWAVRLGRPDFQGAKRLWKWKRPCGEVARIAT